MSRTPWWSRRRKDFRFDWFSGTGAGGQHRNKHKNCLRMTDIETGISTTGQESKSRMQNQRSAFKKIVKLLIQHYKSLIDRPISSSTKVVRTYHKCDDRVTDHLTGKKYSYHNTIGKGDMSQMIENRQYFKSKDD